MNSFAICFLVHVWTIGAIGGAQHKVDLIDIESRLLDMELKVLKLRSETEEDLESSDFSTAGFEEFGFESEPAGNLSVRQDQYTLPGFDCGNGNFSEGIVHIYFPSDLNQIYPITSFLHGAAGAILDALCSSIASLGIVVVAVSHGVCGDWSQQQIHAVLGSEANKNLHPALSHVDFTSVGIIGHSKGALYTTGTATMGAMFNINIKAAVMSHGASPNMSPKIPKDLPVMFVTGTEDSRTRNNKIWQTFDSTPARPSVLVNVAGAGHMAPAGSGPMNAMDAHFLGCFLIPREESCALIFSGSPQSVCKFRPMGHCEIRMPEYDEYDYDDPVPALQASVPKFQNSILSKNLGINDVLKFSSTPAGNYSVQQDGYTLPGFDCGDGTVQDGYVRIYYPVSLDKTYPIVSFLHGSGGGVFYDLCANIASLGIVVVSVARGTCGDLSVQQLHAVLGSESNQGLHPALSHVNYKAIGVIGHSMGGAWTMATSTQADKYNILAAVASHGGSQNAAPAIPQDFPIMMVSGTSDPRRRKLYWAYQATQARPKIFATLLGGSHMAPLHGSPMNTMMAHFLGCYVIPNQESCMIIYGDGDNSLCKANPMGDCTICQKDSTSC